MPMPTLVRRPVLAAWSSVAFACSAAIFVRAFVPSSRRLPVVFVATMRRPGVNPEISLRSRDDAPEDDGEYLDELMNAKKKLFGADIPTNDELKEAAQNAENAFLAAMLEQTRQFQKIKSVEGSEGAVQAFMVRIQEEDERVKLDKKGVGDEVREASQVVQSARGDVDEEGCVLEGTDYKYADNWQ